MAALQPTLITLPPSSRVGAALQLLWSEALPQLFCFLILILIRVSDPMGRGTFIFVTFTNPLNSQVRNLETTFANEVGLKIELINGFSVVVTTNAHQLFHVG
jgi:hypothetical protein